VGDDVLTYVKSMQRVGYTLVPLIFMSEGTHISNFAGDNKEWPGYISIRQSDFEDLPDVLNAQCRNSRSPANSDYEQHSSSEPAR